MSSCWQLKISNKQGDWSIHAHPRICNLHHHPANNESSTLENLQLHPILYCKPKQCESKSVIACQQWIHPLIIWACDNESAILLCPANNPTKDALPPALNSSSTSQLQHANQASKHRRWPYYPGQSGTHRRRIPRMLRDLNQISSLEPRSIDGLVNWVRL